MDIPLTKVYIITAREKKKRNGGSFFFFFGSFLIPNYKNRLHRRSRAKTKKETPSFFFLLLESLRLTTKAEAYTVVVQYSTKTTGSRDISQVVYLANRVYGEF